MNLKQLPVALTSLIGAGRRSTSQTCPAPTWVCNHSIGGSFRGLLALTSVASVLLTGCGGQSKPTTTTASGNTASNTTTLALEPNTVIIGYMPSLSIPQPLIGIQEGEFTRRIGGVAFKEKSFPAFAAVLTALRSGTVDIAYTDTSTAIKAYLKTKNVVLLGACAAIVTPSSGKSAFTQNGGPLVSVYFTTKKFVQANPNFVRRFIEANRAITQDISANSSKTNARVIDAYNKAGGKKTDSARAAVLFQSIYFTSQVNLKSLQAQANRQTNALKNSDLTRFLYDPSKP